MIDRTVRITGYLGYFAVFDINQDPASPMTVTAMAFYDRIVAVDLHFQVDIRLGKGHWVGPVFFQIDQQFLWDGKSIKQAPKWGNKKNALLAIGPGFAGNPLFYSPGLNWERNRAKYFPKSKCVKR
jgi:hypothetical protein